MGDSDEDKLLGEIRDALKLRREINEGDVVILDSGKANAAIECLTTLFNTPDVMFVAPKKKQFFWTENVGLGVLIVIAAGAILSALILAMHGSGFL
jgi:hypothetical protein